MLRNKLSIIAYVILLALVYIFVKVVLQENESYDVVELPNREKTNDLDIHGKRIHYVTTSASKLQQRIMGYNYERRLPKVIGIGVKKCGTTALMRFLALHPDIVLPITPELHFFDSNNYYKGFQYYRSQMPYTAPHEIAIEKSPRYFVLKDVPIKVKQMDPKMKILLVVCDPIKRAYSDFTFESHRKTDLNLYGTESTSKFDDFVKIVLKKIKRNSKLTKGHFSLSEKAILSSWSRSRYYLTILNTGLYSVYLRHWLKYFPQEQFHIINGDDLLTNPVKVIHEAQQFLGLDIKVDERDIVFDKTKGFYCIKVDRKDDLLQCLAGTKGTTRSKTLSDMMTNETLESLKEFYHGYNEDFYKIINKKLDWT